MSTLRSIINSTKSATISIRHHPIHIQNSISTSCRRSIGYLHKGSRVRGLARDPTEYLVNPKGQSYEVSNNTIGNLKKFLGEKYALPDELLLQILTHKSFAHGSKPFNEKLAVYGSHFLKYKATLFSIKSNDGGFQIENLGTSQSKKLISNEVLAEFIRQTSIGDSVFWKKRDQLITNPKNSGENSIYATTTEALIGALVLYHGKANAERFVDEILLNQSEAKSLIQIAQSV